MIIDSHCHLSMKEFDADLDQVIANAKNNDVGGMLTICTKLDELKRIEKISNKYNIWFSAGVHPHNVSKEQTKNLDSIYTYSERTNLIGIGETGLDFYYETQSKDYQIESFIKHIEIARELDIPVIVHTRDADVETLRILKNEYKNGKFKCLIHCFTASKDFALEVLKLDFFISISGIVTFKNATKLRETVSIIPLNKMLIETDAPYLAPVPHRGKRNEPAFVKDTAVYLASLKQVSFEKLINITTRNFFNLFDKAKQKA